MDNAVLATTLSLVVTLLTSLFKSVNLTSKQKNLIATGLSVVAGTVSVVSSGVELTAGNLASTAVAIYGASQIAYQFILKGTNLNKTLTDVKLFGKKAADVEAVLEAVTKVEEVVVKTSKPKKVSANTKTTTSKTRAKAE